MKATNPELFANVPQLDDVVSHDASTVLNSIWLGVFVYAAFQCVSIPAMISASSELNQKGVKRAAILGWVMNGGALAASGAMLVKWYPLLKTISDAQIVAGKTEIPLNIPLLEKIMGTNVLTIPNQTVVTMMGSGYQWLQLAYKVLLFCAFISTSVTLVYSMIQRFQGHCFPKAIKSEAVRSVIVGAVVIGLCFLLSLVGLDQIIKKVYGYDGYYALIVVVLPAFIWGIPKIKKLSAEKKAELSE